METRQLFENWAQEVYAGTLDLSHDGHFYTHPFVLALFTGFSGAVDALAAARGESQEVQGE